MFCNVIKLFLKQSHLFNNTSRPMNVTEKNETVLCKRMSNKLSQMFIRIKSKSTQQKFDMVPNKILVLLVFFSGIVAAFIGTLLHRYFCETYDFSGGVKKVFSPLPAENFLNTYDESTIELKNSPELIDKWDSHNNAASVSEALTSLHLALEMKHTGKKKKAVKLFQHAVALAPEHPDILNRYGEFLEHTQNDIVKANEYYVRALTYQPNHESALFNRERTARVVEELDRIMLRRIDEKRNSLSSIPDNDAALIRAKKEAYFQHIYHTVGIEGNTMNLAQTRAIVETRTAVAGKSIDEHNEILGLDAAMKYINATLVNRVGSISIKDILEIHRRVLGHVDPIEGGQFRRTQVYVGGHIPPGPGDIHYLMEEFASWLNSERAIRLHPVRVISSSSSTSSSSSSTLNITTYSSHSFN